MGEIYISVDIETTGLVVGEDNIASIGACVVGNTKDKFYIELKPFTFNFRQESLDVCGFSIGYLKSYGTDIVVGLKMFEKWLNRKDRVVFVGFPIAFDFAFVHQYFMKYLGKDPFGRTSAGIDLKTFAMTTLDIPFGDTTKKKLRKLIKWEGVHSHNALDDAKEQANLFFRLLEIKNASR